MKVRNFIVDVNVEVYVVIEGACSLPAFYPAFSTLISRDSLSLFQCYSFVNGLAKD